MRDSKAVGDQVEESGAVLEALTGMDADMGEPPTSDDVRQSSWQMSPNGKCYQKNDQSLTLFSFLVAPTS